MIAKVGFAKAAEALTADGWLAVLGNVPVGLSEGLLEPFKEIYLRHAGAWGPPPESAYLPSGPFKSWFDASELFAPVMHRSFGWNQSYTAASYLDLMRTFSYFRLLAPERQEALSAPRSSRRSRPMAVRSKCSTRRTFIWPNAPPR
jgi:hypothetical protein